jgi:ribokinase
LSLPAFLSALGRLGTRYVMLTDGRGGAFVCADGGIVYCPAVEAAVAGTAGAGDAMAATFAAFVALGRPVDIALKAATLNAASVVAHIDTQSGLLRHEALDGRLAARSDVRLRQWKL